MGMAASQARYIALTARKSNVEYEGQQINQARVSLANQTANLFNQMMGMSVPAPPEVADFTTVQYSFSDGVNDEVLSNYYQLGTADSDYNYVVTTYHNEKVFTGSRKKMNDPQVQATFINNYSYDSASYDNNTTKSVTKAQFNPADGTYLIQATDGSTSTFHPVTIKDEEQVKAINAGNGNVTTTVAKAGERPVASADVAANFAAIDTASTEVETVGTKVVDLTDTPTFDAFQAVTPGGADDAIIRQLFGLADDAVIGANAYYKNTDGNYITARQHTDKAADTEALFVEKFVDTDDMAIVRQLFNLADDATIAANAYYKDASGNYIDKAQYDAAPTATADTTAKFVEEFEPQGIVEGGEQTLYTDGKQFVTKTDLDSAVAKYDTYVATGKKELNEINYINTTNDPKFANYTAVGNCALTELKPSDLADEDIDAEIAQIMKDMNSSSGGDKVSAENFAACFDVDANGDLVYNGGIYKFQMHGQTYYTTKNDLDASLNTSIVDNEIDVQQKKLSYYNATYLDTKVEETQKALLETDGQGRFKTMRLENDSVTYTLNTEQITDEDAYNDAMNRYYYENAMYEKAIADINAKTETIQAQDRTLELRMEQLATEQSALQNEMEAVKKVVDKHVELGFKTFGG